MELMFLMFVCGLAVATLVFWPLLNRANRKAAESQQAPSRGKHALGAASAPSGKSRSTAAETAGSKTEAAAKSEDKSGDEGDGEATQPVKVQITAPQPRTPEPMEMPELPTDIFEARYQAKFNRSKRRLERIRSEISKTG